MSLDDPVPIPRMYDADSAVHTVVYNGGFECSYHATVVSAAETIQPN